MYMYTCICPTTDVLQVILKADKTSNNFSDRAILKNLGHWLGLQTLARNKPILQDVSLVLHVYAQSCMFNVCIVSVYVCVCLCVYATELT